MVGAMFGIAHSRLLAYLLIAVVLLLVGANSLRNQGRDDSPGALETASAAGAGAGTGTAAGSPGDGSGTGLPGADGTEDFAISASSRKLVVDVSGAVARPGVYRFADGARVIDAIQRAGGPAGRALVGAINRAALLADGQQVVVPFRAAAGQGGGSAVPVGSGAAAGSGPISFGTATPEQLEEIEGIGPVTAADLIEFRDSRGGIASIDELDQVSGIGPVTMEALRSGLQP